MVKAIALFSGGLDSMLAAEVVRRQNIEVLCLTFETPFFSAKKARDAARQINLPLVVENFTADHLVMLKSPRYGYGKNMNPCIDCHTLMLKFAGRKMEETGADFIITGEVLGQRPMSQGKQSLFVVAKNSGYADYILRPLSALLLEPIKAEREDKIDRSRLLAIQGRGRKPQMQLAADFGIRDYAPPAGGCLLTDSIFTKRLRDLFSHAEDRQIRDIELLKYGRHFRINDNFKIIVGRNRADNDALQSLVREDDTVLFMADFPGPQVLVPYGSDEYIANIAAALCVKYSDAPDNQEVNVNCLKGNVSKIIRTKAAEKEDCERWII
ncbi:MAG: tRNA 4-thiouridine(8) synthase ThiI [Smithellaceae bacterium]